MPFTGWNCSICSEGLHITVDKGDMPRNQWKGANIMVTPCGHPYHAYCITRWLHQSNASGIGTCPNCRQNTKLSICIPTYPENYEVTVHEDDDDGPTTADLKKKVQELTSKFENQKAVGDGLSQENQHLHAQLTKEKKRAEDYKLKFEVAESFKTFAEDKNRQISKLEKENAKLKKDLETSLSYGRAQDKKVDKLERKKSKLVKELAEIRIQQKPQSLETPTKSAPIKRRIEPVPLTDPDKVQNVGPVKKARPTATVGTTGKKLGTGTNFRTPEVAITKIVPHKPKPTTSAVTPAHPMVKRSATFHRIP